MVHVRYRLTTLCKVDRLLASPKTFPSVALQYNKGCVPCRVYLTLHEPTPRRLETTVTTRFPKTQSPPSQIKMTNLFVLFVMVLAPLAQGAPSMFCSIYDHLFIVYS